jgi:hypothetical protein
MAQHNQSADELTEFLRAAVNKARRIGVSVQSILDLSSHNGLKLRITRASLSRFATGHIETINDDDATALREFFTTRDIGRAIVSFGDLDPHPYRLLVNSLLKSSLANPVVDVLGNYFGYHPSLSETGYAVRAVQIRREIDGLIWFEDFLSISGDPDEPAELFHNKGLVIFIAEKPQFISIDVQTGNNLRFFVPKDVYIRDNVMVTMTGPMTSWTRTNTPANRHQRLVRVSDLDYGSMKAQTCRRSMSALAPRHQKECLALHEKEEAAMEELRKAVANGAQKQPPTKNTEANRSMGIGSKPRKRPK